MGRALPAERTDRTALGEALARLLVADLRRDPPVSDTPKKKSTRVKLTIVKR